MTRFVFFETPCGIAQAAAPLYADLAAMKMRLALMRLMLKYSPDQPRVPAGSPDGGQWTDGGGDFIGVAANGHGEGRVAIDAVSTRPILPPHIPASANIDRNIAEAEKRAPAISDLGQYPSMYLPAALWFRDQVNNGGPWDYKLQGSQFEDFGNFNYGATGKALGFSEDILLRMAGTKQVEDGHSRPDWGISVSVLDALLGVGGVAPYGDDPRDQEWIKRGFRYYDAVKSGKAR